MTDPIEISEVDQLEARTRDVLSKLGLEKTGSMVLDAAWLEQVNGRELWNYLLLGAVGATNAGHLWAIIAQATGDGEAVVAYLVDVRKREDPEQPPA
jgi:hypothetical protein